MDVLHSNEPHRLEQSGPTVFQTHVSLSISSAHAAFHNLVLRRFPISVLCAFGLCLWLGWVVKISRCKPPKEKLAADDLFSTLLSIAVLLLCWVLLWYVMHCSCIIVHGFASLLIAHCSLLTITNWATTTKWALRNWSVSAGFQTNQPEADNIALISDLFLADQTKWVWRAACAVSSAVEACFWCRLDE